MHRRVLLGMLVVSLCPLARAASTDEAIESPPPSLQELLERIETLEEDKAAMRSEIDELRTELDDDWLTEQRADQIRSLVADVLADADTRASLLQDGLTAGWSEHFFLASADGRFKLQIDGLLQVRFNWNYHDQPDRYIYGFENTRTRMTFRGHVFNPDIHYLMRGDFSRIGGSDILQDAWLRFQLNNEWSVRVGQFRVPFNREELVAPQNQLVIERSLVNESLNLGRSQGVELTWAGETGKFVFAYLDAGTDNVGGFDLVGSKPQNTSWSISNLAEFAFAARYEHLVAGNWAQFIDFTSPPGEEFGAMVGVAAFYQQDEYGTGLGPARNEERWFTGTGDVSLEWGGANAFMAVLYHYIDDSQFGATNVVGITAQGGVYFTPKFEAYARLEWGWFDINVAEFADMLVLTLGGNYYIDGNDVKLSADIGFGINQVESPWDSDISAWRVDADGAEPQVVIRTQIQLVF